MRKLLLTLVFVAFMAVPAFCSTRTFTISILTDQHSGSASFSASSDSYIRTYRYTSGSYYLYYIVSDSPISAKCSYLYDGSEKSSYDLSAIGISAGKDITVGNAGMTSATSSGSGIGGLSFIKILVPTSYETNYLYSAGIVDCIILDTTTNVSRYIQEDFFPQAPTQDPTTEVTTEVTTGQVVTDPTTVGQAMEVQGQTLAEYLGGYLKLAIFLVIFLIAAFLVLSLLVKFLRRSLG
jgi:hypothetical protein